MYHSKTVKCMWRYRYVSVILFINKSDDSNAVWFAFVWLMLVATSFSVVI